MLRERLIEFVANHPDIGRRYYHRPKYSPLEKKVEPIPYLHLPFLQEDVRRWLPNGGASRMFRKVDYFVSEGFYYSDDVRKIVHDAVSHGAIDYALDYYFPVVAPCSGWATSSYYSDESGKVIRDKHGALRFGIGYFVQIFNMQTQRFVQLGHLANVHKNIPFAKPERKGLVWQPSIQNTPPYQMGGNPYFVWVEAGDALGNVGYSGITYEPDYYQGWERPVNVKYQPNATWSIPHLHFDEFMRQGGKKRFRRDPYGIYSKRDKYPTHTKPGDEPFEPLFFVDESGLPKFIDS